MDTPNWQPTKAEFWKNYPSPARPWPSEVAWFEKYVLEKKAAEAEVLKAYASDHPSGRAVDTGENISEASGIISDFSGKKYRTRRVADIQYDILKPDLYNIIPNVKLIIEEAALKEINSQHPDIAKKIEEAIAKDRQEIVTKADSTGQPMPDIEKLPKDVQRLVAPIRQKYQKLGFDYVLKMNAPVHRMAMGLAHELLRQQEIIPRYDLMRTKVNAKPKKDVVFNTVSHGMFMESLLKEAGKYVGDNGQEVHGIKEFDAPEFGGYIQPAESIYLEINDPNNIPDRIPVSFDDEQRPKGRVFLDKNKLLKLNADFAAWKESLQK